MASKRNTSIIGIDGGGTKTLGIFYREGKEIARSFAGTTRIGTVGVGESCERLLNVIKDLCYRTGSESNEVDAVIIGLAGVWLDEEKRRSTQLLQTLSRGQGVSLNELIVMSDVELALEGAFGRENGIVMICGTGSIGLGKISKGKYCRCGGWGIELDDEGSGAWIGKEGLTAIVRSIDGRSRETALAQVFADSFTNIDLDNPRSIVKVYAEGGFQYHMLAPLVMECAEKGDPVCLEIIHRAAYHLMEVLEALLKYYKTKTVPVALMGGIIENETLLSKFLFEKIDSHPILKRIKPKGSALDGALKIGLRTLETDKTMQ